MHRHGICAVGNLIADINYPISNWPGCGQLATIEGDRTMTAGGLACSVPIDIARLDRTMPIQVIGFVGEDDEGALIIRELEKYCNIDIRAIQKQGRTSYTLVLNDNQSKERTFFHFPGANALLTDTDINWQAIPAKIFHAGYILLMDGLDRPDDQYGTHMARMLCQAQKEGMITSIDVVSENSRRFQALVSPSLKYTDLCIINEFEASRTTGIQLRDQAGLLAADRVLAALQQLKTMGVSLWAVIHAPEGAYGLDDHDRFHFLRSVKLPAAYIQSTTGAGDAFCAGVLYAAHESYPLAAALQLGTATAARSLGSHDPFSGILPFRETMDILTQY